MGRARDIANLINSNTFITPASASATYLSQTSASSIYLSNSSASFNYISQNYGFFAGKNKIINGDFSIWQRGTSITVSSGHGYTADRWRIYSYASNSGIVSQQLFTPGNTGITGYEPQYFLRATSTNTRMYLQNLIEDVRTLAGQVVTISFWAKSASNQQLDYIEIEQNFGSGGSTAVFTYPNPPSVTTSWVRYSITLTIPSISGKTIGTSSFLGLAIVGKINNALDLWGVQLELGSIATPFVPAGGGTIQNELELCQRYYLQSEHSGIASHGYEDWSGIIDSGYTSNCFVNYRFPVEMRTAPAITVYSSANGTVDSHGRGQVGSGGVIVAGISRRGFQQIYHPSSSLGSSGQALRGGFRANAEL